MMNVMSKLLNIGMSLDEVIATSTWYPAQYIMHEELGHLSEGAMADIALLSMQEGNFGFADVRGKKIKGNRKLECELTILDGKVVYDLNGLSMPEWQAGTGN
jgi:dihydroorotase